MSAATTRGRTIAVPGDRALPRLGLALDAGRMAELIARALPAVWESGTAGGGCRIERVKYRPGRNCVVLYRIGHQDAGSAGACAGYVHAGLYSPEEARRRHASECATLPERDRARLLAFLPEHGIVLRAFPHDRKLPALRLLGDSGRIARSLAALLECQPDMGRRRLRECRVVPVSYFPEHACTVRVAAAIDGGASAPWTVYAKTDAARRGAATFAAMNALWASRGHGEGGFRMARPLAWQADASLLWQEGLAGEVIERAVGASSLPARLAQRIGESVAALHATPLAGLQEIRLDDLRWNLRERSRVLGSVLPALEARLSGICEALARNAPEPMSAGRSTLHGDLHLNNLLVCGSDIGIVDFDDLRAGSAAIELGSFVAGLLYRARLMGQDEGSAEEAIAAYLDGWQRRSRARMNWPEVRWHAAAALIHERAWRCLTSLKPGRLEIIPDLIELARRWSDVAGAGVRVRMAA